MLFLCDSGKKSIIIGIVEVDEGGIPVKAVLRQGEIRSIYKDKKGYWLKKQNNKFYFDESQIIGEKLFTEIHIKQCLKCSGLEPETNRCLSPEGFRSFKGHTNLECRYFKERPNHEYSKPPGID